eukprot:41898_1
MQPQNFTFYTQRRELLKLTKTELIKRCIKHKLSTRGGKADLADRLLQKLSKQNTKLKGTASTSNRQHHRTRTPTKSKTRKKKTNKHQKATTVDIIPSTTSSAEFQTALFEPQFEYDQKMDTITELQRFNYKRSQIIDAMNHVTDKNDISAIMNYIETKKLTSQAKQRHTPPKMKKSSSRPTPPKSYKSTARPTAPRASKSPTNPFSPKQTRSRTPQPPTKSFKFNTNQDTKPRKKKTEKSISKHTPRKQKNIRSRTPQPPSKSHTKSKSKSRKKHPIPPINHEDDDDSSISELMSYKSSKHGSKSSIKHNSTSKPKHMRSRTPQPPTMTSHASISSRRTQEHHHEFRLQSNATDDGISLLSELMSSPKRGSQSSKHIRSLTPQPQTNSRITIRGSPVLKPYNVHQENNAEDDDISLLSELTSKRGSQSSQHNRSRTPQPQSNTSHTRISIRGSPVLKPYTVNNTKDDDIMSLLSELSPKLTPAPRTQSNHVRSQTHQPNTASPVLTYRQLQQISAFTQRHNADDEETSSSKSRSRSTKKHVRSRTPQPPTATSSQSVLNQVKIDLARDRIKTQDSTDEDSSSDSSSSLSELVTPSGSSKRSSKYTSTSKHKEPSRSRFSSHSKSRLSKLTQKLLDDDVSSSSSSSVSELHARSKSSKHPSRAIIHKRTSKSSKSKSKRQPNKTFVHQDEDSDSSSSFSELRSVHQNLPRPPPRKPPSKSSKSNAQTNKALVHQDEGTDSSSSSSSFTPSKSSTQSSKHTARPPPPKPPSKASHKPPVRPHEDEHSSSLSILSDNDTMVVKEKEVPQPQTPPLDASELKDIDLYDAEPQDNSMDSHQSEEHSMDAQDKNSESCQSTVEKSDDTVSVASSISSTIEDDDSSDSEDEFTPGPSRSNPSISSPVQRSVLSHSSISRSHHDEKKFDTLKVHVDIPYIEESGDELPCLTPSKRPTVFVKSPRIPNKMDMVDKLQAMQFCMDRILRAFKVYERNYGTKYNIHGLIELIQRLRAKDIANNKKAEEKIDLVHFDQYAFKRSESSFVASHNRSIRITSPKLFIPHMTQYEAGDLCLFDNVDHRDATGRFCVATIIAIDPSKSSAVKIHYEDDLVDEYDVWSDYRLELFRFAKHRSISRRKQHLFVAELKIGDRVKVNPPKYYVNKSGLKKRSEWIEGILTAFDKKSAQIQIAHKSNNAWFVYWTHCDNLHEITKYSEKSALPSSFYKFKQDRKHYGQSASVGHNAAQLNLNGVKMFKL